MIIVTCIILAIIICFALIYTYFFRLAFCKNKPQNTPYTFSGSDNEEHKKRIKNGLEWFNAQPKEDIYIESHDGLKLHGVYLNVNPETRKLILMFHGYRSSFRDFACAYEYYAQLGFNMIVVDQRSHGLSEGKFITYGVLERYDVVSWLEYAKQKYPENNDIYIDGISMGASTVLMASDLVTGVKGIIADCGYTSAKDIITCVAKGMHVPAFFVHPLGFMARIFCGIDYTYSTVDSLKKTNIPVIFVHGLSDDFVPAYMTEENYQVCNSKKTMVLVENAPHGYSFLIDEKRVKNELERFFNESEKGAL